MCQFLGIYQLITNLNLLYTKKMEFYLNSRISDIFSRALPQEKLNNYNLHLYRSNYIVVNLTCLVEQELNKESMNVIRKPENVTHSLNTTTNVLSFI